MAFEVLDSVLTYAVVLVSRRLHDLGACCDAAFTVGVDVVHTTTTVMPVAAPMRSGEQWSSATGCSQMTCAPART
ncbi:MAG: hypothetical protein L0H64_00720 [Pseudonocardia sp.]|nr:hypothetical protein [Pseudonocardia sp.]